MVLLQRKQYFSKDSEEVEHFPGGPTYSRRGPNANFKETHITCAFPWGSRPPISRLDPHMLCKLTKVTKH